ncbi:hypothetical protein IHE44_0009137 [Lamprotornis superbus]|uniref:Uncharacterized protein n=1 Tax=Lamprotornis superbus TaxID=245042 RepID=A0A835NZA5_9PASS|nr:hypothetical protein IHE44_0009137 [Lamprotornis superbus]
MISDTQCRRGFHQFWKPSVPELFLPFDDAFHIPVVKPLVTLYFPLDLFDICRRKVTNGTLPRSFSSSDTSINTPPSSSISSSKSSSILPKETSSSSRSLKSSSSSESSHNAAHHSQLDTLGVHLAAGKGCIQLPFTVYDQVQSSCPLPRKALKSPGLFQKPSGRSETGHKFKAGQTVQAGFTSQRAATHPNLGYTAQNLFEHGSKDQQSFLLLGLVTEQLVGNRQRSGFRGCQAIMAHCFQGLHKLCYLQLQLMLEIPEYQPLVSGILVATRHLHYVVKRSLRERPQFSIVYQVLNKLQTVDSTVLDEKGHCCHPVSQGFSFSSLPPSSSSPSTTRQLFAYLLSPRELTNASSSPSFRSSIVSFLPPSTISPSSSTAHSMR